VRLMCRGGQAGDACTVNPVRVRFSSSSESATVAAARSGLRTWVAEHCEWAPLGDVVLAVSELLTNAVRHSPGPWSLEALRSDAGLTVTVSDACPDPPKPRAADVVNGGGFGWHMVHTLADDLIVRPHEHGKDIIAVWSRTPCP
jgi:anti-sigma regulatory factor (Ser/Thr protein kinase)